MAASDSQSGPRAPFVAFATTQWTRIAAAKGTSPESKAALADLCAHYYEPVRAFIARRTGDTERAEDRTHDFFAQVLAGSGFENLNPETTRFRTYLLGAVKHFLSNADRKAKTLKRGGGQTPASLSEDGVDESELAVAAGDRPIQDPHFDYDWALTVMTRALDQVEADAQNAGRANHFERLKPWLVGQTNALPQKVVAEQLGISEGALKVAIHRLRKQFRDHVKREIADTLGPEDTIETELAYLVEVLSQDHATS